MKAKFLSSLCDGASLTWDGWATERNELQINDTIKKQLNSKILTAQMQSPSSSRNMTN